MRERPAAALGLRRAGANDLAFVMETERRPDYRLLVGQWSAERHLAAMASADFAYLVATEADAPVGFAILRTLRDPNGNVGLQRIAMVEPGRGLGRAFLAGLLDWTFRETDCHRLCLEVFTANERARRVYASLGFVEEGILRQVVRRPDGSREDQALMSILRPDWEARSRAQGRTID